MTKTERTKEIMEKMKSFAKDKYQKTELLNELFALQQEIVEITFNGTRVSTAGLKIWDVERHFEQMNRDCGNVADEALLTFKNGSKTLCNLIKAEVSGARGEAKAFRALQYIQNSNIVLRNVEMSDGDQRTELDAIVIMPESIALVEVKNTAKDIFIDEKGDYYRTGEFLKWDCNIAEKMMVKEKLLRKALECGGIQDAQIRSIVVFTNNRIEVQNKCPSIRTCFVSQLPCIMDGFKGSRVMSDGEMHLAESAIRTAENKEAYPLKFDVEQYKQDFVTLMVTLEETSTLKETAKQKVQTVNEKRVNAWIMVKNFLKTKRAGYTGKTTVLQQSPVFQ